VEGRHFFAGALKSSSQLEQTAGIAGDHHLGASGEEVLNLAIAELPGRVRLHQVINAGGAAANGRIREIDYLEVGDSAKHGARLIADSLRVLEMAGIVVAHAKRDGMTRGTCRD